MSKDKKAKAKKIKPSHHEKVLNAQGRARYGHNLIKFLMGKITDFTESVQHKRPKPRDFEKLCYHQVLYRLACNEMYQPVAKDVPVGMPLLVVNLNELNPKENLLLATYDPSNGWKIAGTLQGLPWTPTHYRHAPVLDARFFGDDYMTAFKTIARWNRDLHRPAKETVNGPDED